MQSGSYDRIPLVNYELERIGVVMEPEPNNPREAWGY